MSIFKRFLALTLAMIMTLSLCGISVLADGETLKIGTTAQTEDGNAPTNAPEGTEWVAAKPATTTKPGLICGKEESYPVYSEWETIGYNKDGYAWYNKDDNAQYRILYFDWKGKIASTSYSGTTYYREKGVYYESSSDSGQGKIYGKTGKAYSELSREFQKKTLTSPGHTHTDACYGEVTKYNWVLQAKKYNVTFNDGNGAISGQNIEHGKKATKPTDPTRENYDFAGWYTTADGDTEFDFDTRLITAPTTIYAHWTAQTSAPVVTGDWRYEYYLCQEYMNDKSEDVLKYGFKSNAATLTIVDDNGTSWSFLWNESVRGDWKCTGNNVSKDVAIAGPSFTDGRNYTATGVGKNFSLTLESKTNWDSAKNSEKLAKKHWYMRFNTAYTVNLYLPDGTGSYVLADKQPEAGTFTFYYPDKDKTNGKYLIDDSIQRDELYEEAIVLNPNRYLTYILPGYRLDKATNADGVDVTAVGVKVSLFGNNVMNIYCTLTDYTAIYQYDDTAPTGAQSVPTDSGKYTVLTAPTAKTDTIADVTIAPYKYTFTGWSEPVRDDTAHTYTFTGSWSKSDLPPVEEKYELKVYYQYGNDGNGSLVDVNDIAEGVTSNPQVIELTASQLTGTKYDAKNYAYETLKNGAMRVENAESTNVNFASGNKQEITFNYKACTTNLGSITISKSFVGLPDGTRPASVSYSVTGNNYSATVTLPDNGSWSKKISDLAEGEYTITETSAAVDGYTFESNFTGNTTKVTLTKSALDKNTNSYTVSSGTADFTNTYSKKYGTDQNNYPTLTINKVDASGNPITVSAAVFTITKEGETTGNTITTNNGIGTYTFTSGGEFTLVESTAPVGYNKSTTTWTIQVTQDSVDITGPTGGVFTKVYNWIVSAFTGDKETGKEDYTISGNTLTVKNTLKNYTVTYSFSGELPGDIDKSDLPEGNPFTVSHNQSHDIQNAPHTDSTTKGTLQGTWSFDGWKLGSEVKIGFITVTGNVELVGTWTFTEDTKYYYRIDKVYTETVDGVPQAPDRQKGTAFSGYINTYTATDADKASDEDGYTYKDAEPATCTVNGGTATEPGVITLNFTKTTNNEYGYTVYYYKDAIDSNKTAGEGNCLGVVTGEAEFDDTITVDTSANAPQDGYTTPGDASRASLKITTDPNANTATVVYTKNIDETPVISDASFTIRKIDSADAEKLLGGAVFTLTKDASTSKTFTTVEGQETVITIPKEWLGTDTEYAFTLEETKAPTGYNKPTTAWTVKVALKNGEPAISLKEDKSAFEKIYDWTIGLFIGSDADSSFENGVLTVENTATEYTVNIKLYTKDFRASDYAEAGSVAVKMTKAELAAFVNSKLNDKTFTGVEFFDRDGAEDYALNYASNVGIYKNGKEYGLECKGANNFASVYLNGEALKSSAGIRELTADKLFAVLDGSDDHSATLSYNFAQIVHFNISDAKGIAGTKTVKNIFTTNTTNNVKLETLTDAQSRWRNTGWTVNGKDIKTGTYLINATAEMKDTEDNLVSAEIKPVNGINELWFYFVPTWENNTFTVTYKIVGDIYPNDSHHVDTYEYDDAVTEYEKPKKEGYDFVGWNWDAEKPAKMPARNIVVTGQFTPAEGTKYTVKHEFQNIDDDNYSPHSNYPDQNLKGTTGEDTAAAAYVVDGFTAKSFTQQKIAPDGSTVVTIQYDRKNYNVSYVLDKGYELPEEIGVALKAEELVIPKKNSYRFGEEIDVADALGFKGYDFNGWYLEAAQNTPDLMAMSVRPTTTGKLTVDRDMLLTGYFTPRTDISYTVHYYRNGTTTKVADDKVIDGKTFGTEVEESAVNVSGYSKVGDTTKKIILDVTGNEIIFYYSPIVYLPTSPTPSAPVNPEGSNEPVIEPSDSPVIPDDPTPTEPTPAPEPSAPVKPEGDVIIGDEDVPLPDAPQTGDNSHPLTLIAIMAACLAGIGAMVFTGRKKRRHN